MKGKAYQTIVYVSFAPQVLETLLLHEAIVLTVTRRYQR